MGCLGLGRIRGGLEIVGSHLLGGKDHMDRVTRPSIVAGQKHIETGGVTMDKARLCHRGDGGRQIGAAQENIHVLSVPHGGLSFEGHEDRERLQPTFPQD